MTSHELAKKLLEMPDVMVTVRGYEGGVDEVVSISNPADLALNIHEEWYYGEHDYKSDTSLIPDNAKIIQAIHIG